MLPQEITNRKGYIVKHITLLAVAGVILAGIAFCTGGTSPDPSHKLSDVEQLKEEVASLRRRVEALEQQLTVRVIPLSSPDREAVPGITDPYGGPREIPSNWRRFEFNGLPYYVIPVGSPQTPTQESGTLLSTSQK
jgi:hypothetical protein